MSAAMAPPEIPLVSGEDVSIARLHGEACWHCGAVTAALATVGSVATATDGGIRIWPVTACPPHRAQDLA